MGWFRTLLLIIAAVILPPLAVFLMHGCHRQFWINVLLTLLGYIPGIIHALYLVAVHKERHEI